MAFEFKSSNKIPFLSSKGFSSKKFPMNDTASIWFSLKFIPNSIFPKFAK